jgi:hypothetical protein
LFIHTLSGALYEVRGDKIRRINPLARMRKDGDWLSFTWHIPGPVVGQPMHLALEPLGEGNVTYRTTTPVEKITRTGQ